MLARVATALAKWVKPVSVSQSSSSQEQKSEAADFQRQYPRDGKKKKRHLEVVPSTPTVTEPEKVEKPEEQKAVSTQVGPQPKVNSSTFLALFEMIQKSPKKVGKWLGNKKYLRESKQSAKSKAKTQGLMIDKKIE